MPQYTLCHHTCHGPMGLGQYNSLVEYCGPHAASYVFFILALGFKKNLPQGGTSQYSHSVPETVVKHHGPSGWAMSGFLQ